MKISPNIGDVWVCELPYTNAHGVKIAKCICLGIYENSYVVTRISCNLPIGFKPKAGDLVVKSKDFFSENTIITIPLVIVGSNTVIVGYSAMRRKAGELNFNNGENLKSLVKHIHDAKIPARVREILFFRKD